MKYISEDERICECCMKKHQVKKVSETERVEFKDEDVQYEAVYWYCENADELFSDEEMIASNDIAMKNAYRRKNNLLTTDEIVALREKYAITQSDLCRILGWGGKTIARYEGHQVQDKAHDTILRKIYSDPVWFLELLDASSDALSESAVTRCRSKALLAINDDRYMYSERAFITSYIRYYEHPELSGGMALSVDRVADTISYFACSDDVNNLYKVKLMKMLWYADALSYIRRGHSITGLVYRAMPMGALPVGHELLLDIEGIFYEEIEMGDSIGYRFMPYDKKEYPSLTEEDMDILNQVINRMGSLSGKKISDVMHNEDVYQNTEQSEYIRFDQIGNLKAFE